jgi:hypothetical protein
MCKGGKGADSVPADFLYYVSHQIPDDAAVDSTLTGVGARESVDELAKAAGGDIGRVKVRSRS